MTSFAFVRHPYVRLVSAFEDKFLKKSLGFESYRQKVRKSFSRFIDLVINEKFNRHWSPFHLICDFCDVDFKVIGKLETFEDDLEAIEGVDLKVLQLNSKKKRPEYKKFFEDLNPEQLKQLKEIYFLDFKLFDYDPNKF